MLWAPPGSAQHRAASLCSTQLHTQTSPGGISRAHQQHSRIGDQHGCSYEQDQGPVQPQLPLLEDEPASKWDGQRGRGKWGARLDMGSYSLIEVVEIIKDDDGEVEPHECEEEDEEEEEEPAAVTLKARDQTYAHTCRAPAPWLGC